MFAPTSGAVHLTFELSCEGHGVSFRPWVGFNYHLEHQIHKVVCHSKESIDSIFEYHPAPNRLSEAAKKLMSRNYFQVNGVDHLPGVDFVVCCADVKNGEVQGGTGQAVRIATARNIPVINIRSPFWESSINRIPIVEHVSRADLESNLPNM